MSNVERLVEGITAEWLDSYSDSGAIWQQSFDKLQAMKAECSTEEIVEAYTIARERWAEMTKASQVG